MWAQSERSRDCGVSVAAKLELSWPDIIYNTPLFLIGNSALKILAGTLVSICMCVLGRTYVQIIKDMQENDWQDSVP